MPSRLQLATQQRRRDCAFRIQGLRFAVVFDGALSVLFHLQYPSPLKLYRA